MASTVLPPLLVPHVCAVLQDAVDQLAVLGGLMPAKHNEGGGFMDTIAGEEITRIIEEQRGLEAEYDQLLAERAELEEDEDLQALEENEKALREIAQRLKLSTTLLCKNLKSKPNSLDNVMKIHNDRKFVLDVLDSTIDNLVHHNSYEVLVDQVEQEREENNAITEVIQKERKSREMVKQLKAEIQRVKDQKEHDIQERNELIAQLKDQRQEARVRTQMETDYIERSAQVSVQMANKRKQMSKSEVEERIAAIKQQMEEEKRVHAELETFLKRSHAKLAAQLDEWSEKFDQDNEAKQQELEKLRDKRAQDLAKLQDLTETYNEYDRVIAQDRKKKLKLQEDAQRSVRELAAAIRLQAWWRGILVRHKLGPHKDKKAKKGKKSGKKKKKK
ncbi:hypothetical protein PTSG_09359 [Salpingoeca rosetta]|uniref:Dynein regulatory complex protein 9 n=1 Tax=Salpingoeca rosetta (strain ATCC 50818 / BSB-021) TaxID=946362 RepID=F2UME4_SALR5|nr:uncharacterized protein PTSG_09359 [Salpingoeca rosetta]EGD78293.1 hypothetical protein PTSG_09359 [Salpingoeca rosetta]|eukprot:XP_004989616.1 hypothetical protein PTSG_09359 [Salpingoeca rosetta]